jgi:hypothetical protein
MTLDDIAESIGTVSEAQHDDDHDRLDDSDMELADRQTEEYDGGWSVDH